MPTGNHQFIPHGLWFKHPNTTTIPRLLFGTVRAGCGVALLYYAVHKYRSMMWEWTFTDFIGKTMVMGKTTQLTHEPASVEYIDKLKAEEAARKRRTNYASS